ncbi:uncharacterized protein PITG_15717 [Phytophthora infestans T30-4]|uniref:Uncharacterized protein n=1 Tax=Phytophthora infestans (strain T30-4) TaxID=403677 RepID=D0NSE4_PHYIT|nr:uncharacterized protein PITG_15717 [Phytophthora infestans T30-4]EEY64489.1 hypothetical protein PITG_15717 [Phytophthora infestans T30-4]|eukprot:XP_002897992.1 hypothetical protein PITG_15717 [Phytophthora infestans T30-4]
MHHQDQELHQKQYHEHNHENEHKHEEEQGMESELVLVQQQSEVANSDTVLFELHGVASAATTVHYNYIFAEVVVSESEKFPNDSP